MLQVLIGELPLNLFSFSFVLSNAEEKFIHMFVTLLDTRMNYCQSLSIIYIKVFILLIKCICFLTK